MSSLKPASAMARSVAKVASNATRPMVRVFLRGYCARSTFGAGAARRVAISLMESHCGMCTMPCRFFCNASDTASRLCPMGLAMPTPVMTTRLRAPALTPDRR